jgi:L-ribulose-5-phosphate 3-epimerase
MRALGAATYTYLWEGGLAGALERISALGFASCEIMATPPHIEPTAFSPSDRAALRDGLDRSGLALTAVNPTFLDLNLASTSAVTRAQVTDQVRASIELASDLGADFAIVSPGRCHPLIPAPMDWLRPRAVDAVRSCVELGERLGVTIVLENIPSGFLERGEQLAELCDEIASPACRVLFDVANAHMVEDPVVGLRAVAPFLAYVHLSDTTRQAWGHLAVGAGDVDFGAFASELDRLGYDGPTTLEVIDGAEPDEALRSSAAALEDHGWQLRRGATATKEAM